MHIKWVAVASLLVILCGQGCSTIEGAAMGVQKDYETVNYKETINLPKTNFKQKASLITREPGFRKKWDEMDLYHKIQDNRAKADKYILHDGPPYASGELHIGTGMNKILKDLVVKFKSMSGYLAPYIPGWDCHGLPIEHFLKV